MAENISRDLIKQLAQLACVADKYQEELLQHCYLKNLAPGGVVLRKKQQDLVQCYLIQGDIEVWHSFNDREHLNQDSIECQQPLNDLLFDAEVIRAKSRCKVLRVNNNALGRLMALSVDNSAREDNVYEEFFDGAKTTPNTNGMEAEMGHREKPRVDYFAKAMVAIFNKQYLNVRPVAPASNAANEPAAAPITVLPPVNAGADESGEVPSTEPAAAAPRETYGVVTPLRLIGRQAPLDV